MDSIGQNVPKVQWFIDLRSTYHLWLSEQKAKGSEGRFLPAC